MAKMTIPKNAMIGPTTAQKLELVIGLLLLIVPRPWNMKIAPNTAMSAPTIIMVALRRRDGFDMPPTLNPHDHERSDRTGCEGGGAYGRLRRLHLWRRIP